MEPCLLHPQTAADTWETGREMSRKSFVDIVGPIGTYLAWRNWHNAMHPAKIYMSGGMLLGVSYARGPGPVALPVSGADIALLDLGPGSQEAFPGPGKTEGTALADLAGIDFSTAPPTQGPGEAPPQEPQQEQGPRTFLEGLAPLVTPLFEEGYRQFRQSLQDPGAGSSTGPPSINPPPFESQAQSSGVQGNPQAIQLVGITHELALLYQYISRFDKVCQPKDTMMVQVYAEPRTPPTGTLEERMTLEGSFPKAHPPHPEAPTPEPTFVPRDVAGTTPAVVFSTGQYPQEPAPSPPEDDSAKNLARVRAWTRFQLNYPGRVYVEPEPESEHGSAHSGDQAVEIQTPTEPMGTSEVDTVNDNNSPAAPGESRTQATTSPVVPALPIPTQAARRSQRPEFHLRATDQDQFRER